MWGRKKEKAQAGSALCGKEAGMNMSKCTRCAMRQGMAALASVTNTAQATETMLKLHRRLTVLPFARFLGIQIFFGIAVGIFAAFSYFIKRAR